MKYLHLIWAALFRSRTRTVLTLLSIAAAFLLFGMLDSVRVAFAAGSSAGRDRLVVASRASIMDSLPQSLAAQIEKVPGVAQVTSTTWFGGVYQDEQNFFPNFSVAPNFFAVHTEYRIDPAQLAEFANRRTAAIVGEALAQKHDWKIGDRIPLQAPGYPQQGSNDWNFELVGTFSIADDKRRGEEMQLMFRWDYFDEANDFSKGRVGWYTVRLADVNQATSVAQAIDALSRNSDHETRTQTEQAFSEAFTRQFADIGLIVAAIMAAVFFTLLLISANTMTQAVRERIPEIGVLKTLGFSGQSVLWLVLAEALLLIVTGGVAGLALASLLLPLLGAASGGALPLSGVALQTWLIGFAVMTAMGIAIGLLPALRAMRLKIVDALVTA